MNKYDAGDQKGDRVLSIDRFQLTRFESTFLEQDLRRRLNLWTERWSNDRRVEESYYKKDEQRQRSLSSMEPTSNGQGAIRFLTNSVDRMTKVIDKFVSMLDNFESYETPDANDFFTKGCAQMKKEYNSAMRSREAALMIRWRLFQPLTKSAVPFTLRQLPQEARPYALEMLVHARQMRLSEGRHGAVPKQFIEEHGLKIMNKAFQEWKRLKSLSNSSQPPAFIDDGLELPPPVPVDIDHLQNDNDVDERKKVEPPTIPDEFVQGYEDAVTSSNDDASSKNAVHGTAQADLTDDLLYK